MKQRFRLYRRNGGIYYIHDDKTGKQESLHTRERVEASALFAAKTQSHRQAHLNLRLARTYLAATDPMVSRRTWQLPMDELGNTKRGPTLVRWQRAIRDKAFDLIRNLPILETQAEHFLKVLYVGTVSTNVFLRRIHNFALDMGWLPWPVVVKRQWPSIEFKEKRAITWEEHCQIVEREKNPERKAFYKMAWHMGASQTDLAFLEAENIDWEHHVISYARKKTGTIAIMRFDVEVAEILRDLPGTGPLFPYLRADKRLIMISLSVDVDHAALLKFVKTHNIVWTQAFIDLNGWKDKIAESYGVYGIPSIFFIGPDGKLLSTNLRGPNMLSEVKSILSQN